MNSLLDPIEEELRLWIFWCSVSLSTDTLSMLSLFWKLFLLSSVSIQSLLVISQRLYFRGLNFQRPSLDRLVFMPLNRGQHAWLIQNQTQGTLEAHRFETQPWVIYRGKEKKYRSLKPRSQGRLSYRHQDSPDTLGWTETRSVKTRTFDSSRCYPSE